MRKSCVFYTVFPVFRGYLVRSHFYLFCWPKRVDTGSSQETIMEEWILFQPLSRLQWLVQKVDLQHATLKIKWCSLASTKLHLGLKITQKMDKINKGILKSTYKERTKLKLTKNTDSHSLCRDWNPQKRTQTSNPATASQRPEEPVSKTTADVCVFRSRLTWH